ncbi:MAG: hypothetical protein IPL20_17490 [Saprospiraceae bacterium]|nr:hypothetical protein [Saprospiraceae bacterium]
MFAAGAFCAGVVNEAGESAELSLVLIVGSLLIAAILGDTVNYWIGNNIGLKILRWEFKGYKLVNEQHLETNTGILFKTLGKDNHHCRIVPAK